MTISFGFNGAVAQSTLCNYHDLAPNYAASLTSLLNGISSCAGFMSPMVVGYFTQNAVRGLSFIFYFYFLNIGYFFVIYIEHNRWLVQCVCNRFNCVYCSSAHFSGDRKWRGTKVE